MPDYYFSNQVFVTSVKDFEPFLTPLSKGSIASDADLLSSKPFADIFAHFLKDLSETDHELYAYFAASLKDPANDLISLTLLLLKKKRSQILMDNPLYSDILGDGGLHYFKLMNHFFSYWLSLARFAYLDDEGKEALSLLKPRMLFLRKSVFHIYNALKRDVLEKKISLETDYSAGFLAGFTLRKLKVNYPKAYRNLCNIPFISAADLNLPYCTTTKRNKRIGVYQPISNNPIETSHFKEGEWLCLPLKIGSLLLYFYFSYKYANTVLGSLNLFEKADISECGRRPDLLIVFGGDQLATTGVYYEDDTNAISVGYVSDTDEADYFGYVKKLVLTLYNLRMIEDGALPIHGSMVKITLKGGKSYNLVIMGDSGAGKSESIEAFRLLAKDYLENITIVFDDMGTLFRKDGRVYASGTEIGAFVRLDDLDVGYAFSHLNDALMYNLGENNARLVYPCTPYEEVVKLRPIDMFLYANNYEDKPETLTLFKDAESFVKVAEEGKRKAKGTTGEVGLVSSYFANPFGPVQLKERTHPLVELYFSTLLKNGCKLGVIYTKLAVEGHEKDGPQAAAKSLLEWIKGH